MSDLEQAFKALAGKQQLYNLLYDYYSGDHPLVYTAKRLNEIFKRLDVKFSENWCSVIIDAVKERIELAEIKMPNEQQQETMNALWDASEMNIESDDVHEAALWAGESFIVVWPDENNAPQAFYNDPRLCHVFYESDNPRKKKYAAKWWIDDDDRQRLTLYYPDRLEYYISKGKHDSVQNAASFIPIEGVDMADNPYGIIPVFHFRTKRTIQSDLSDVIPIQDAINKTLADMMVVGEYGAYPQRYIISNADIEGKVKNAPNEILDIPAAMQGEQATEVGQFDAANLVQYLDVINGLIAHVSAITRTPHHYFVTTSQPPSGEALIVMESGLVKKTMDRINRFIPTWRRVAQFMLLVAGVQVNADEIEPQFDEVATVQPWSDAQIRKTEREMALIDDTLGVSKQTILTNLGYDAEEEVRLKESEGADMADTMLSAFDRDGVNA